MEILHDYRAYIFGNRTSLTIGNFDGLHLGHRRILQDVVETARRDGCHSLLITFEPHPLQLLNPGNTPPLITSGHEKNQLIADLGIDLLLVLKFDQSLSLMDGRQFVSQILCGALKAKHIFVGKNFVFGHRRSGNVELLQQMAREQDFNVHVIPEIVIRGSRISSTWIRELIQSGRISQANRLLGRYYSLSGPVIPGMGLGHRFLFPTLNLDPEDQLVPKAGVYVTVASFLDSSYESVTNIGWRPTVSGRNLSIETHLLDRQLSEPPDRMDLCIVHRLRNEQKFDSIESLRIQIERDCGRARRFFQRLERFKHLVGPSFQMRPSSYSGRSVIDISSDRDEPYK